MPRASFVIEDDFRQNGTGSLGTRGWTFIGRVSTEHLSILINDKLILLSRVSGTFDDPFSLASVLAKAGAADVGNLDFDDDEDAKDADDEDEKYKALIGKDHFVDYPLSREQRDYIVEYIFSIFIG